MLRIMGHYSYEDYEKEQRKEEYQEKIKQIKKEISNDLVEIVKQQSKEEENKS